MKDNMPTSMSGNIGYRPFIKNISIQQVPSDRRRSGDGTNKTFFSNIKAELNNIRTDVNKLVSKDISKNSNNKSYTMGSSAQKFQPSPIDTGYQKNIERRWQQQQSKQKASSPSSLAYEAKIAELTSKLNFQNNKNEELINQIEEQRKFSSSLRDQAANFREKQMKFQYEINIRNKQLENQKFLYQRLIKQKQQSAKTIEKLQSEIRRSSFKPVEKVVQSDLQSLEKIKFLEKTVANMQGEIRYLREDCNKLRFELDNFEKNKQIEIVAVTKNFEEKIGRAEAKTYKQLGAGFQIKINELLDENYSLKNKIGMLQSQIQQDRVQLQSLRSTVQAYEVRDRQLGKGVMQQQLQNLQQKVMQLQQQKDKMQSDHEFQIMKLENTIDELKSSSKSKGENKSFNQILKDQINQIENLKQRLRERNEIINKMKK